MRCERVCLILRSCRSAAWCWQTIQQFVNSLTAAWSSIWAVQTNSALQWIWPWHRLPGYCTRIFIYPLDPFIQFGWSEICHFKVWEVAISECLLGELQAWDTSDWCLAIVTIARQEPLFAESLDEFDHAKEVGVCWNHHVSLYCRFCSNSRAGRGIAQRWVQGSWGRGQTSPK